MRRWAFTVGINQYQYVQPLSYAQQDAQALRNFLLQEADFAPEHCLLLADGSAPTWGQATTPDRVTILNWLDWLCQQYVQPGDLLWFFFSGYGVCQGGRDYLLPIDGNPVDLEATAIPLEAIYQRLQITAADSLVLLDFSRSQGSLPNEAIGAQTVHLAGYTKVPTILSCQPGQFSYETAELQHGFFTATLLEALREQRYPTAAGLHQHLSRRLPVLTDHFLRPVQQPLIVSPPDRLYQVVLPQPIAASLTAIYARPDIDRLDSALPHPFPSSTVNGNGAMTLPTVPYQPSWSGNYPSPTPDIDSTTGNFTSPSQTASPDSSNGQAPSSDASPNGSQTASQPTSQTTSQPTSDAKSEVSEDEAATELDVTGLRSPLLWGSLVAATLLMGVLGRNWTAILPGGVSYSTATIASPGAPTATTPAPVGGRVTSVAIEQVNPPVQPTTRATQPVASPTTSPSPLPPLSGQVFPAPVNPPPSQPYGTTPKPTVSPTAPTVEQRVTLTLSRERMLVNSDQASPFWYAIQDARKVPPNSPDHAIAQQDITNWSGDIWSIANRRADQRKFVTAIMAAGLVPKDQAIYAEVEKTVPGWCAAFKPQTVRNVGQRRQATVICRQFTASRKN